MTPGDAAVSVCMSAGKGIAQQADRIAELEAKNAALQARIDELLSEYCPEGKDVIIDGVRYVPDPLHANTVKFYFMHDDHTFTRLKGATLDEVLAHADAVEVGERGSYGMLCPAMLLHGKKEVRRVGPPAHARGSKDPKDHWNAGKAKWREAMETDIDVMRLLPSNEQGNGHAGTAGATRSDEQ